VYFMITGTYSYISIALISFIICSTIVYSKNLGFILKKIFYVPCKKSDTGAQLLGGLGVLIGSFAVLAFSNTSISEFLSWGIPASLLGLIGYLDDRTELKAYIKLSLQFLAAVVFSILISYTFNFSLPVLGIIFFWSLGVFNGSNLLDGIDSYSVKYSTVSYLAFTGIGLFYGQEAIVLKSLLFTSPMMAFYFYNKFPSKLHLGEIGGTIIGLNGLYLATSLYNSISTSNTISTDYASLFLSLSILHIQMTEVGISLLRRIFAGKSPFFGDKKHIHYLLSKNEKRGPSLAASILSLNHFAGLAVNFVLAYYTNITTAFLCSGMVYVGYQLFFGLQYWKSDSIGKRASGDTVMAEVITLSDYAKSNEDLAQKKAS
jgi:UDP-GlcNAc:undecaprenyl-phosphate GlcNAc-1-phosphate transferase